MCWSWRWHIFARFKVGPLERGFGITLGNSLRRILLSSLPGYAINAIKIDGVNHEFSTIPGVTEDVTDLILNLKQVCLKSHDLDDKQISIKAKGPCEVTAGDIITDSTIEVVNKDLHLAYLDDGAVLNIDMSVIKGRGYQEGTRAALNSDDVNMIPIDSIFTPVKR